MNRLIKFRAWDKEEKIMFYPDFLILGFDEEECQGTIREAVGTEDSDMTLMQYTGLNDKNGKKIYEGDIVEHKVWGELTREQEVVKNEAGLLKPFYELDREGKYLINQRKYEVIGNKFENPELLK